MKNNVGENTFTFPNGNCFDVYKVNVFRVTSQRGNEIIHKCEGEEYFYVDENGTNRMATSDVTYTKRANNSFSGCDSLVNVLFFTILDETTISICQGGSYRWYREWL